MNISECMINHPELPLGTSIEVSNPQSPCMDCNLAIMTSKTEPQTVSIAAACVFNRLTYPNSSLHTFTLSSVKALIHKLFLHYLHQPHLRPHLESILPSLSISYDKSHSTITSSNQLHMFLITTIIDTITSVPTSFHSPVSQLLTYTLNDYSYETKSCLFFQLSSKPSLLPQLLKNTLPNFHSFNTLVRITSKHFTLSSKAVSDILQHFVKFMPIHPHSPADEAFLIMASHQTCTPDILFNISITSSILRRTILSSSPDIRLSTADILLRLTKHSSKTVIQWRMVEYTVEAIRNPTPQVSLLFPPLQVFHELISSQPQETSFFWAFSLLPILQAAQASKVDMKIRHIVTNLLALACQYAPSPVFVKAFKPIVDFFMSICASSSRQNSSQNENQALLLNCVSSLIEILQKFRLSVEELHRAITACEAIVYPCEQVQIFFELIIIVISQFKRLVSLKFPSEENGTTDSVCRNEKDSPEQRKLRDAGYRLLLLVFSNWACVLEQMLHEHGSADHHSFREPKSTLSTQQHYTIIQMLTVGLDKAFICSGACSADDQHEMRRWCWRIFPPFCVIDPVTSHHSIDGTSERTQQLCLEYIQRIAFPNGNNSLPVGGEIPTARHEFLRGLSRENSKMEASSFYLLTVALSATASVESIGPAIDMHNALRNRLTSLASTPQSFNTPNIIEISRILMYISLGHDIPLRMEELPDKVIIEVLSSPEFNMTQLEDREFLLTGLCYPCSDEVLVHCWHKLTSQGFQLGNDLEEFHMLHDRICKNIEFCKNFLRGLFLMESPAKLVDSVFGLMTAQDRKRFASLLRTNAGYHYFTLSITTCEDLLNRIVKGPYHNSHNEGTSTFTRLTAFMQIAVTKEGDVIFEPSPNLIASIIAILCHVTKSAHKNSKCSMSIALLRYLIAVYLLKDSEGFVESNQGEQLTDIACSILANTQIASQAQSDLISCAAALLGTILKRKGQYDPKLDQKFEGRSSILFRESVPWQNLLLTIVKPHIGDHEPRVINICFLLNTIFHNIPVVDERDLAHVSAPNVIVLLCLGASSENKYISTAAYEVLTAINLFSCHPNRGRVPALFTQRRLSTVTATSIFSNSEHDCRIEVISYLSSAIAAGHFDEQLCNLLHRFLEWISKGKDGSRLRMESIIERIKAPANSKKTKVLELGKAISARFASMKIDIDNDSASEYHTSFKPLIEHLTHVPVKNVEEKKRRFSFNNGIAIWSKSQESDEF